MTRATLTQTFKRECNLWWIALGFFTRLPVPASLDFSQNHLNQASRYFPLVGWLIGVILATSYWLLAPVFGNAIAIILSMGIGFLLTGGFHEDGLADTADGLGGGWSIEQKLTIMKDSRLGSYGALAIWFALTLKFIALWQMTDVIIALLVAHPLSRLAATMMMQLLPYVSDPDVSKSKPLAEKQSSTDALISVLIGSAALLLVASPVVVLFGLVAVIALLALLFKRQIGGFTGDTLGATQQLSELAVYLCLLANGGAL